MKNKPIPQSRKARNKPLYVAAAVGIVPVILLAVYIAPHIGQSGWLLELFVNPPPFSLTWTQNTPRAMLMCLFIYGMALLVAFSSRHKYHRRGEEHGSADWANIDDLRREFHSDSSRRIIYTQNLAISYEPDDLYKHKRNLNALIVGGPGSGKTRGFVFPNLLEAAGDSYVVLDPKGESCRTCGGFLQKRGYDVKVLDLIHLDRSWGYNPFEYIENDDDVQKVVTAIFKATSEKNAQTLDPFWDNAGMMLLSALMYLLIHFGQPQEKNFAMVMQLIRSGRISGEEDTDRPSPLDILFQKIEAEYPEHICVRYFQNYSSGADRTKQSVQITLLARLQKFELETVASMTSKDELKLSEVGDKPTALFLCIPDNDPSYNFIVGLLYIQLFQQLSNKADEVYHGRLPHFVHVIMDEFANVHTPDDFLSILATCRSRNIGISIIIQNYSQLKEKYKEGWENIPGQCDEQLYLNGNEYSGFEHVSKMLGKETIDTNSFGRQYGDHGHSSKNDQAAGRELLDPSEVRLLDYGNAILFVKNAPPLVDAKYDCAKHPNAAETSISGSKEHDYYYGARAERNGEIPTKASKAAEQTEKDPFEEIIAPADTPTEALELHFRGAISDVMLAQMLSTYTVATEDLAAYFNSERI